MKLKELKEFVNGCNITEDVMDWTVVIATDDRSIGAQSTVGVKGIFMGFDWDSGKVIIYPDQKVRKVKNAKKYEA